MPFHTFNHFTGRLKESNRLQPLYPIPPVPLESSEPPQIMFESLATKAVKVAPALGKARYSSSKNRLDPKNHEFMKKLQSDLEAPVYLAKGTPDKILFGFTVALVAVGFVQSMYVMWQRATKRI